jgi:hypothetical protein
VTTQLYTIVRVRAATALFNWTAGEIKASVLADDYLPDMDADLHIDAAGPRYADVVVTGRLVDPLGWWLADQIDFPGLVLPAPASRVALWAPADGMPILLFTFPPLAARTVPETFTLVTSTANPGLARL